MADEVLSFFCIKRVRNQDSLEPLLIHARRTCQIFILLIKNDLHLILSSLFRVLFVDNLIKPGPVILFDLPPLKHLEPLHHKPHKLVTLLDEFKPTRSETPPNPPLTIPRQLLNQIQHHHPIQEGTIQIDLFELLHGFVDLLDGLDPERHQ